jgi:hypothetical protein
MPTLERRGQTPCGKAGRPAAKRPASGVCPAAGRGSSRRNPLLRIPAWRAKKMHRVGLASVQPTRSTFAEATAGRESLQPRALRARCTRKPTGAFARRQAPSRDNVSQIATFAFSRQLRAWFRERMQLRPRQRASSGMCPAAGGDQAAGFGLCRIPPGEQTKCTESGAPSSDLPTDRRRSDCLSEGHQPRALRPRCNRDTTAPSTRRQVGTDRETRSLRSFPYTQHKIAPRRLCSKPNGTMDSPSRVRFRPLPRLTFRFRVRPPGRASS